MKSSIKSFLKTILVNILTSPPFDHIGERVFQGRVTVFFIHRAEDPEHRIRGHSKEFLEEAVLRLKRKGYRIVSLEDIVSGQLDIRSARKTVVFTLDDGFADQADLADQVFTPHNCKPTIFLVTDFLDGELWPWDDKIAYAIRNSRVSQFSLNIGGYDRTYDLKTTKTKTQAVHKIRGLCKLIRPSDVDQVLEQLGHLTGVEIPVHPPEGYQPMSWQRARELENTGVRFAPHTATHRIVSRLSQAEVEYEIRKSVQRLAAEIGKPLNVLAWPTGRKQDFDEAACRLLPSRGIGFAFSTEPGVASFDDLDHPFWRYRLNRMTLPKNLIDVVQYSSWIEPAKVKVRVFKQAVGFRIRKAIERVLYGPFLMTTIAKQYASVDWGRVKRIVFICKGNICRSPYAEYKAKSLGLSAVSVGLHARPGSRANDRAIFQAERRGVNLFEHRSAHLSMVELGDSDLVVGMEPWHISALRDIVKNDSIQKTVMGLWGNKRQLTIDDPYGGSLESFDRAFSEIDAALRQIRKLMS